MRYVTEEGLLEKVREQQSAIYRLDTFANSLIMDLLVSAKLSRMSVRRLGARTAVMNDPYVQKRAAQPFKRYEGAPRFDLSVYGDVDLQASLSELARSRKSSKAYAGDKLTGMHISALLKQSYGVMRTELLHEARVPWQFRPIPSPGGLFATEIYLILINSDLPQGLYHYRPDLHALEQIKAGDFSSFVASSCGVEPYLDSAAKLGGMLLCTSLIERLFIKYGERTYKFMMIETGLLGQQLSLAAEALGLGSCMLGGYFDDEIHDFLAVDGVLESVQNVMAIGHKRPEGN
jgi:SagB-type dehydrogenase family enzyme